MDICFASAFQMTFLPVPTLKRIPENVLKFCTVEMYVLL